MAVLLQNPDQLTRGAGSREPPDRLKAPETRASFPSGSTRRLERGDLFEQARHVRLQPVGNAGL